MSALTPSNSGNNRVTSYSSGRGGGGGLDGGANGFRVEAMRTMSTSGVSLNSNLISKELLEGDGTSKAFDQKGGLRTPEEFKSQFKKK